MVQTPSVVPPTPGVPAQRTQLARGVTPPAPPAAAVAPPPTVETPALLESNATRSVLFGTTVLSGIVRDNTGVVLPGVTVMASAGGIVTRATTDSAGRYALPNLDAGQTYRVTAELAGFTTASAYFQLDRVSSVQRDFTMGVGSVAETIVVTGAAPVVDSRQQS